jgi:hypothetical protein
MANHPVNLLFRFGLELIALAGLAYWGWVEHEGLWRLVMGLGLPFLAAALWGTFRIPGDSSASGKAPVAVPGWLRLLLELLVLFAGALGFWVGGLAWLGAILFAAMVVHYVLSYDRIVWMLSSDERQ